MSRKVQANRRADPEHPEEAVKVMKKRAIQGDADDVLRVIDEYCEDVWMMNVGDEKGLILDKIFKECNPSVAIELGGYIGYSAVRMARLLKDGGRLYTMEIDPHHAQLMREVVDYAGLGDKVTIINETAETFIPEMKEKLGIDCIDFVFIDHVKNAYLPDAKRLLETGLLRKGGILLADNTIYPGCPDYLKFIRNHPKFTSEAFDSHLEYTNEKDSMEKSVYLG